MAIPVIKTVEIASFLNIEISFFVAKGVAIAVTPYVN
jgi:hypothetical protein